MKRTLARMSALVMLVGLSGCGLAGEWKTVKVTPEGQADRFAMKRVTFDKEGFYVAWIIREGRSTTIRGKYDYEPASGTLNLAPRYGDPETYKVSRGGPRRLIMRIDGADGPVRAVLVRRN